MSYSTTSAAAREVCEIIGADPRARFVKAFKRNGKTYVSGTLGKPQEWAWLKRKCEEHGFVYRGHGHTGQPGE